jgi:tetratricopeptide (TPR) repeat protein
VSTRRGQALVFLAGAAMALAAAVGLQVLRDRRYALDQRRTDAILYVRSGPALKRLALGFDALAADVYWIRALQHYGGERRANLSERKYDLLYPLLDITTTLDPYFTLAYRFGAIFLGEAFPGGPGRPDLAVALLRKGIAAQPDKWQYYLDAGFVYYWHLRDFKTAAVWFRHASEQPNAPNWLAPLAATMLIRGGDRVSARFLWEQLLQADQPWLRSNARHRLAQIDALEEIDRLERVVRRVTPPGGPYGWEPLIDRRILPGIPLDPAGTPYEIDSATGRVRVSGQSDLFPMPDDLQPSLQ